MTTTPKPTSKGVDHDRLLAYELTPIADLIPSLRNAREHSASQLDDLADCLDAFGFINPVIIDIRNYIYAGHGRVEAAKRAGKTSIATLRVEHLSEAQLRLYAIADNRIAERSTWNDGMLAVEFRDLRIDAPELNLSLSGFEHPKIELKIASLDQSSWSDLDKAPEPDEAEEPITRLGDIWEFAGDEHRLVCGDSTSPEVVGSLLGDDVVDLVVSDLPYNLDEKVYSGNGKHQHGNFAMAAGEMSREQFVTFLAAFFTAVLPFLRSGALLYAFMDWRHIADLLAAGDKLGFDLKNLVVWDKGKGGMGALYRSAHELIAVFKHGTGKHINNIMLGKHGRDRHNIWRYAGMNRFGGGRDRALSLHATVKPVQLLSDLLLDASNVGDIVFDGFGGSGSTMIAAHKKGRRARLVELDPRYCDVTIQRFINAFQEEPVERSSGMSFSDVSASRRGEGSSPGEVNHG
jgi:DNA modification methylase